MFEIFNELDYEISETSDMKKVLEIAIKEEELNDVEFNVILVDNNYIHELNKNYRKIDRETDVISFAFEDNMDVCYKDFRLLGDIYISIDRCYSQALEYGHSREREICFLATHGILHLLGYDHMEKEDEEVMNSLQNELLDGYDIKR